MKTTRRTVKVSELKVAPDDLRIVQAFVNTADRIHGSELLTGPKALADWLKQTGLVWPDAGLTAADVQRTIAVREDLRGWLAANNRVPMDAVAAERLDRVAELALVRVRVAADGATRLESAAEGLDNVFGRLLAIIHDARGASTWSRLKACAEPACRAAFHDFSPNQAGVWCAMRRCGNRVKGQAWRRRDKRRGFGY